MRRVSSALQTRNLPANNETRAERTDACGSVDARCPHVLNSLPGGRRALPTHPIEKQRSTTSRLRHGLDCRQRRGRKKEAANTSKVGRHVTRACTAVAHRRSRCSFVGIRRDVRAGVVVSTLTVNPCFRRCATANTRPALVATKTPNNRAIR